MSYIEFRDVCKVYKTGEHELYAADHVNFDVEKGRFCVVVGQSGAGKSTILNLLGGLNAPTSGRIAVDGREISAFNARQLTDYRRYKIGFVFQNYNLIANLTARENVEIAAELCKNPMDAAEALAGVGLEERMGNFPAQLSGGEQQRVSIARAIAKNPKLLLCDEPTGALDYETGKSILKLLRETCARLGATVIVITHNQAITHMADQIVRVKNGRVEATAYNDAPRPVEELEW